MAGIIANKLEMTRIIKDNKFIPITLLSIPELRVVGKKTLEIDGYEALIIGVLKQKSDPKITKDKKTLNKKDFSSIKEFPLKKGNEFNTGDTINLDILENVKTVTIKGVSKGKGFSGAMKRHNFHGGPKTHGSKFHRALGSIGNRKPTRTHKGKKMHGHYGNVWINLKKVPLELINKEISVIGVRGGIPGGRNSELNLTF